MKATVQKIDLSRARRILVTSDIHGHARHLASLLSRAKFGADDALVIVGDPIQKGPYNLETLRLILDLYERGNVYVSAGNVDRRSLRMFYDDSDEELFAAIEVMRGWGKHVSNLYDEMASELGLTLSSPKEVAANRVLIAEKFAHELEFLSSRPTVIDAGEYIFVHGGLPSGSLEVDRELDEFALLKVDAYYKSAPKCERWTIVGHWPVTLYGERIAQANPLVDYERKIVSLDGGIGLKHEGQLNLLVIENGEFTHISEDFFPVVTALDAQSESRDFFYIRWGDCDIRVLERGGETSLIEHLRTGYKMRVPTGYLLSGGTRVDDVSDYRPEVRPGDRLALVRETDDGCFIKKDGVSGRYYGRFER